MMRIVIISLALAVLGGSFGFQSSPSPRRMYIESELEWKTQPLTSSGGVRASSYIDIFYPDHRFISAGVILGKKTKTQGTPYIIENEGFSLRSGVWSEDGPVLSVRSKYVHLDQGVSPAPPPVKEQFKTGKSKWAIHGGPIRSQTTAFIEIQEVRGIEHLEEVAAADSCNPESKPSDLGDSWVAFCEQQAPQRARRPEPKSQH